jgi:two-component system NtrC family sensor kinase
MLSPPSKPKVLVVDDEHSVRVLLRRILERAGYDPVCCSSASEAKELISRNRFQAALCDLKMPGESGLELAKWILENQPEVAVLIVSVVSDLEIAHLALETGVYGYVTKPFSPDSILINLAFALDRKRLEIDNLRYRTSLETLVEERTGSLKKALRELEAAQLALRESEARYRSLFDRVPLGLFRTTPEGRILDANRALVEMLGFESRPQLLASNAASLYADPLDRVRWKAQLEKTGVVKGFQKRLRKRDGSIIWVEDNTRVVRDERGRIICFEGSIQDITQRKLVEEALQESQRKYLELFDQAPVGYFEYDRFGRIYNVNRTQAEMLGYSRDEILGHYVWEFFTNPEPGRSQILAKLAGALPPAKAIERYYRRKDGTVLVGLIQDRLILDDEGRIEGIRCTVQDITERKRMEEELRRAHDEKELLIGAISSLIIRLDSGGKITEWNHHAESTLGIPREKAMGRPLDKLAVPWEKERVIEAMERCLRTAGTERLEDVRFTTTNGKEGLLGLTFSPVVGSSGKLEGVLILGADITERRLLERQLAQAQKLEAIGQLAAGIAHEINTPIQYVGDNVKFLKDAFQQMVELVERFLGMFEGLNCGHLTPAEARERALSLTRETDLEFLEAEVPRAVDQTMEGVERVAKIVRAMKEFSHPGKREQMPVDINRALESTVTVSKNEWKYVSEVVMNLEPDLPMVNCDPAELNQVFLNIIVNAAHAIAEKVGDGSNGKGTITISTRTNGPWVEVRVEDTGCGIPEEIRSKVFDPFFTTKEVGRGTGQGLAICYNVVVKKLGGMIFFESKVGEGTTFFIRLPFRKGAENEGAT